jgi:hypothetical protein
MSLVRLVKLRNAVDELCAAIDRGEVVPGEEEMLALGLLIEKEGGPLKYDLLVKVASRCKNGQKALKDRAH